MIKGKQNLLAHYDANGNKYPYWIIFPYNSRVNKIATCPDTPSLSPAVAREALDLTLQRLEAGTRYNIAFREDLKDSKGYIETPYENDGVPVMATAQVAGIGMVPAQNIEELAEKKALDLFTRFKTELQIEAQEKRIKELEKQLKASEISPFELRASEVMAKFPKQTAQMMAGIGKLLGAEEPQEQRTQIGINGFETEVSEDQEAAMLSELNTALEMWREADFEFLQVIKKIAYVAKTNPSAYRTYKPMILGM